MRKRALYVILLVLVILIRSSVLYARDLPEILDSGYITVGTRDISIAVYNSKNKDLPGFCYEIANSFASDLGVSMKLYVVDKFGDYWMKDGRFLTKSPVQIVTPDIYKKVDMVADIITVTEKRKKLVNMVPFIENTELFFTRKDINIKNYEDFRGHKVFVIESMVFYPLLKKVLEERDIPYVINYVKLDEDGKKLLYIGKKKPVKDDEVEILLFPVNTPVFAFMNYYEVIFGNADVSIQDTFSFFLHYFEISAFTNNLKPLFPMQDKIGYLSFCIPRESPKLTERFEAFMKDYRNSYAFSSLVKKYMGLSYEEYKKILSTEVK